MSRTAKTDDSEDADGFVLVSPSAPAPSASRSTTTPPSSTSSAAATTAHSPASSPSHSPTSSPVDDDCSVHLHPTRLQHQHQRLLQRQGCGGGEGDGGGGPAAVVEEGVMDYLSHVLVELASQRPQLPDTPSTSRRKRQALRKNSGGVSSPIVQHQQAHGHGPLLSTPGGSGGRGGGGGGGHPLARQTASSACEEERAAAFVLELNAVNYERLKAGALNSGGSAPFVISLIGDTHAGKTTLVKPLLLEQYDLLAHILQGSTHSQKNFSGTSANVCTYRSTPNVDTGKVVESPVVYVWDFEGSNAVGVPSILQKSMEALVPPKVQSALQSQLQSSSIERRSAVNKLLPMLAYFMSDMVVFIDNTTFDNTKFAEKIKNFVSATGGIADKVFDPTLIVISNKCALKGQSAGIWDIEKCTKKFMDSEQSFGLANLHQSVHCICLPDWNASDLQMVNGRLVASPVGATKYAEQISALQSLVKKALQKRMIERIEMGLHISERTWLEILKLTIEDFPSSIEVKEHTKSLTWSSKFYSIVTSPGSEEVLSVTLLFSQLLEIINSPNMSSEEYFSKFMLCRETAFVSLAVKIALRIKQSGLSSVQTPDHLTTGAPIYQVKTQWVCMLRELAENIEDLRPCCANYPQLSSDNIVVQLRCTQTKRWHMQNHRNPNVMDGPEVGTVTRLFYKLVSFLGIGFPLVWTGKFQPDDNLSLQVEEDLFTQRVIAFLEMPEETVLFSMCEQLEGVLQDYCEMPIITKTLITEIHSPTLRGTSSTTTTSTVASTQITTLTTTTVASLETPTVLTTQQHTAAPPAVIHPSTITTKEQYLCMVCLKPQPDPTSSLCAACAPKWKTLVNFPENVNTY
ncbi:hypothetical protein Pelo_8089 [Pelomyxa schiedti]|nr:hypothetical protein Pelo_8089 [Pelomyxa schiedti]